MQLDKSFSKWACSTCLTKFTSHQGLIFPQILSSIREIETLQLMKAFLISVAITGSISVQADISSHLIYCAIFQTIELGAPVKYMV